jgi:hypothetical protein
MARVPLELQCQSMARTLHAEAADEIQLLRTARRLKRVHEELCQDARRRAPVSHAEKRVVTETLAVVERELRIVLLGHQSLSRGQLREHVLVAYRYSTRSIDLLQAARVP